MTTIEDIKDVIVEQLSVDAGDIKEETKFIEDLGADSLDIVELIMALEEKFDVEIPDSKAESIKTVKDALDYINEIKA